jgi:UBX domain-containing protein 7
MMTEDEQMQAALAASLGRNIHEEQEMSPPPESIPPPSTSEPTIPQTAEEEPTAANTSIEKPQTLFSSIVPSDTPEPPQSPQTTRIQFRFPDGSRPLVRRFNKTDTIRDVFAFVKALRSDEDEFELVFVGRRLLAEAEESADLLERNIVEAGLANGSLTVEV